MICWIVEAIAWAVAGCVTTLALAHACNGPALVDPRVPATACLALAHVMDLRWLIHMCLLQPA